jgi:2-keto-4-pentenoate hydratase
VKGPDTRFDRIRAGAELLARHRLLRVPFAGFPDDARPRGEDDGYAIQSRLHELLEEAGHGRVSGHKIGCTTPTMQAYLGIPRPAGGGVFDTTVREVDGRFRHGDFVRPGVECEVAVRLGRDLDAAGAPFERTEIAAAAAWVMAAIEVVDDRYSDWGSLGATQLIADDFFGAGCVLGVEHEFRPEELDLTAVSARMTINGVEVGAGVGADILGDPLTALMWLVNEMTGYGHSFRAGEFVLLGSLVQTHWVEQNDVVEVENLPLGRVTARFA